MFLVNISQYEQPSLYTETWTLPFPLKPCYTSACICLSWFSFNVTIIDINWPILWNLVQRMCCQMPPHFVQFNPPIVNRTSTVMKWDGNNNTAIHCRNLKFWMVIGLWNMCSFYWNTFFEHIKTAYALHKIYKFLLWNAL